MPSTSLHSYLFRLWAGYEYRKEKDILLPETALLSGKTKDDLSLAYTPGVAQPCLEIQKEVDKSYELTRLHNLCAVITGGTAVLSLGDIGPAVAKAVAETARKTGVVRI